MTISRLAAVAAGVTIGLSVMASARAETFADFGATSGFNNIQWTQSVSGTSGTLSTTGFGTGASADINFTFLDPSLSTLANLPALLTFTANGGANDPAQTAFGYLLQGGLTGGFSITYEGTSPLSANGQTYTTGANLLSGTFSGGNITGQVNASAGGINDATSSGGVLAYSSDFLQFQKGGDDAYSLSLTSIANPLAATAGMSLNSFGAVATGSFQADLTAGGGAGGVPEPSAWALMLLGFAGIGAAMRSAARRTALPTRA